MERIDVIDVNKGSIAVEKTLSELKTEHEKGLQKERSKGLENYFRMSRKFEEEFNQLSIRDAQDLNSERERLEKKIAELKLKNAKSNFQSELLLLNQLKVITRNYNIDNAKQELSLVNSSIRELKKHRSDYEEYIRKKHSATLNDISYREQESNKKIEALKTQLSNARGKKNRAEIKSNLDSELKNLKAIQQERQDAIADYQEKKSKGLKTELKEEQELRLKTAKDIYTKSRESGKSISESYKAVLDVDPNNRWAYRGKMVGDYLGKITDTLKGTLDIGKDIKTIFEQYIQDYSSYQSSVNARLQGSGLTWNNGGIGDTLTGTIGSTPYVKLSKLLENASKAVESGIAYNIEQRAFLETIKEDIATTFDAFEANLLRLIRLQQNDSTAARLGLEADLTQLFNSYFSDTSYLLNAFDTVSANLTEAIAQMGTEEGLAFEYQVQKWLGSLYSVGFSDSTISNIATALGMLGSGDVSGLASNSQMQNLIVMAASRVGLSYADMLTEGLDADTTNELLASMVEYLQEIATSDNKVIKSQYSQIFGLTSSDLVAAENLGNTISNLTDDMLTYGDAINELYYQVSQLPSRLSMGEMTGNLIDNVKYAIASGIADNPVTYALWEITDMIEGLSGGINAVSAFVMGTGFNLGTSITNLMRLGIVGAGALGNIGSIVSGVGNTISPTSMLDALGFSSDSSTYGINRGNGLQRTDRVINQVSRSNMLGNSNGQDYVDSVTQQAEHDANEKVQVKQNEEQTKSINDIHEYLLQVFDPKITGITRMLGVISGTKVSSGDNNWGEFTTKGDNVYKATTVSITNIGESNMSNQTLEHLSSIDTNVETILSVLKGTLTVSVLNYGLVGNNVPDWGTRNSEGNW